MNLTLKRLFSVPVDHVTFSIGILPIRILAGIAFAMHGWGKIQNPFSWMGPEAPVPGFLQFLAALSEFGGGIAWVLGLLVPLASFGAACTMAVAIFFHAVLQGHPFIDKTGGPSYEPASLFFVISILFLVAGPGRFSLDRKLFGNR